MSHRESRVKWNIFINALKQEVKPALGCTEPVSVALACAVAVQHLSGAIVRIEAAVSPNLMKNGMGVTIPGTGMTGLPIAAALGAIAGDPQAKLEVLKKATQREIDAARALLEVGAVRVVLQDPCDEILYVRARVYAGDQHATVTIVGDHTNVVSIEKMGQPLFIKDESLVSDDIINPLEQLAHSSLRDIYDFISVVPCEELDFILDAGSMNNALSKKGLSKDWGLHIGPTLKRQVDKGLVSDDIFTEILYRTSAASDARMGGATLPAMTNSGSGNQGITATMPVVVAAERLNASPQQLVRALALSHLVAIYIHCKLPRLSALCATTTAGMGAAAGIIWLMDGNFDNIAMAVNNMIGDVSGMICDGASSSCSMKVSTSISSAWKAILLALDNSVVSGNDGIVERDVENSIRNLCDIAGRAMQHTDRQIIEIMAHKRY
ncbi:serine dehydratase subunit alpha family protein [Klebsiella sp. RHBSTW-00484]|uniref:L-cysteine desulfidase family protein n=1 Tax=unclassified Klebsiella TaxID=2608929 RepID=UPI0015E55FB5|nr:MULTISPECIES: L-serine ammonia-lyase, iron-sulfur-dependent, subunit alpha [unclassified Klebsiella]MBA7847454.1 serine dehydratase subunit alpha family protein [Klebsiella sp. RHBSTW-00465]QLO36662.1 serine dehydratase subunit alpha family protein [Klebsiella sp. RHBSTW-00484]QLT76181.1 serine dehydratase subunit alpha family protein [Klebsiella sp. RHBSTW-00464]